MMEKLKKGEIMDMSQIAYSLVLEFLRRAMGCLSSCFRIRDDHRTHINRINQPITAIPKEPDDVDPLVSNCVWSLLPQEDEDGDLSQCEDGRYGVTGSPFFDDELRAEAKFLKACGTLPQTPVEFRRTEKAKDSQPHNGDTTSNSQLPNTAIEEALLKQPDQLQSPVTLFQKWENGSDSSSHSSNSLKNTDSISSNSFEGFEIGPAASTHCKNKSVHFESQSDSCSMSSNSSSPKVIKVPLKLYESPFDHTIPKPSPYPTPLKLTDDMQTPGTVFPSYGKNPRIRVQYVYSGINPRNFSQLDTPIEEECIEQSDKESPQSQVKLRESETKKELNVCPTLSSWLPPKSNHEGCIDQSLTGLTPGDRPILGVVTSNWNADVTSFTPKWGDGNGIPNTTNKYSEDQKVRWHATPFGERLEKALLEDKFIPKMNQLGETTCVEL